MRGILTLFALILSGAMASAQPAPQTACDALAGLWLLPRAEGLAQVYAIEDAPAAIAACDAARAQYPSEPAFALLLARALMAADPNDTRAVALVTGAQAELPALGAAQLAAYYENGLAGLPASERIARDFYARACEGWPAPNARPGCAGLARMMIEGRGGPADESGGFEMLQNLCTEGWAMACTDLAQQQELRGEASDSQVTALLARACDGGDLFGCSVLGFRYETETGAPYDIARARALYERACDGGEVLGCGNLGEVYRSGLGVAPDIARAVALFGRACTGNDAYACVTLGDILANGRGVPADVPRAIAAFDQACLLGDPEACDQADILR